MLLLSASILKDQQSYTQHVLERSCPQPTRLEFRLNSPNQQRNKRTELNFKHLDVFVGKALLRHSHLVLSYILRCILNWVYRLTRDGTRCIRKENRIKGRRCLSNPSARTNRIIGTGQRRTLYGQKVHVTCGSEWTLGDWMARNLEVYLISKMETYLQTETQNWLQLG